MGSSILHGMWHAHTKAITACAFHPTKHIVATASKDRTLKLWGLPGLDCLVTLAGLSSNLNTNPVTLTLTL